MRSKFEQRFADDLDARSIRYEYEGTTLAYSKQIHKGYCQACQSKKVFQHCTYLPDFFLPVQNIFIETKGRFTGEDRKKHLAVREANPEVDIRFVFMSNNKIHKKSDTRYGDWCDSHGFKYAIRTLPKEWVDEKNS